MKKIIPAFILSAAMGLTAYGASEVFMTKDISSEGLMKVYEALNKKPTGKVAVKISTGEPGGHNFLSPDLIKKLVTDVNGTIVECNTAYGEADQLLLCICRWQKITDLQL